VCFSATLWNGFYPSGVFYCRLHTADLAFLFDALNEFVQGIFYLGGAQMQDFTYMSHARDLAKRGCGWVSPNPMVGAVIVKNKQIIGEGYHARCGEAHAERNALAACTEDPAGATLYVTLEPCCHHGRTPPCTDAIIEAGLSRVVVGSRDPNPLVAGKGVALLRQHGIEVREDVLREDCDRLNAVFLHFIQEKTPFVVMKYAMTMDGKIATVTGASQWITGEAARQRVHEDRHAYRGIMVGVGTVLADDPQLTCRLPDGRNPLRIICDSELRTPLSARVVTTTAEASTLLATCCSDEARLAPYRAAGCEILSLPRGADGHLDLSALMQALGAQGIDSVYLEGGATLNWAALQSGIVHRVQAYLAPKLFGGAVAMGPLGGAGVLCPSEAYRLSPPRISHLGEDILLECEVLSCSQES